MHICTNCLAGNYSSVGTPSALESGWSVAYSGEWLYIFLIYMYYFYHLICLCNDFYRLSAFLAVGPRSL